METAVLAEPTDRNRPHRNPQPRQQQKRQQQQKHLNLVEVFDDRW